MTCPFCAEDDFDRVGLFLHLMKWDCPELVNVSKEHSAEEEERKRRFAEAQEKLQGWIDVFGHLSHDPDEAGNMINSKPFPSNAKKRAHETCPCRYGCAKFSPCPSKWDEAIGGITLCTCLISTIPGGSNTPTHKCEWPGHAAIDALAQDVPLSSSAREKVRETLAEIETFMGPTDKIKRLLREVLSEPEQSMPSPQELGEWMQEKWGIGEEVGEMAVDVLAHFSGYRVSRP